MPKALFIIPLVLLLACVSLLFSYSGTAVPQETQIEVHSVSVQTTGTAQMPKKQIPKKPVPIKQMPKTQKEVPVSAVPVQLPSVEEDEAVASSTSSAQNVQRSGLPALGSVRINTATQAELDMLPGIGPVKAQAILDYIRDNGPFQTVEELMEVKGIGEVTLEKMRPYLAPIN